MRLRFCFPAPVWTEPCGGLGTVPGTGAPVVKLECLAGFSELMPGKRSQASGRKPSESQGWSEAEEEHKGAVKMGKGGAPLPQDLGEGSWKRCLGNKPSSPQEGGGGKGRERKVGGLNAKHAWGRCRCPCDGSRT